MFLTPLVSPLVHDAAGLRRQLLVEPVGKTSEWIGFL